MNAIPKSLVRHSDETNRQKAQAGEEIERRRREYIQRQPKFFQEFGKVLSAEQITALETLLMAFEIQECAGNASSSNDGVPIPDTFGPKTYSDRVLNAQELIRSCRYSVHRELGWRYVNAWSLLQTCLVNNLTPQTAGDYYDRSIRGQKGRDARRAEAINIVSLAADVCVDVVNQWKRRRLTPASK